MAPEVHRRPTTGELQDAVSSGRLRRAVESADIVLSAPDSNDWVQRGLLGQRKVSRKFVVTHAARLETRLRRLR